MKKAFLTLAILAFLGTVSSLAAEPLTIDTVKGYLTQMKIEPKEAGKNTLEFKTGFPDGTSYTFMMRIDASSKFAYLAIVNLGSLKASDAGFCAKSKKLLNLNYGIALAKLEWDEPTGEIRLSNSFATERGFTKADMVFWVQSLLSTAEKLEPALVDLKTK